MKIFLLFVILSIIFTYPLIFHLSDMVKDAGDPFFCAWTIAWDIHSFFNHPLKIFDANIFYPHPFTLAYSEHMIGTALVGLPVWLVTQNIIFVYNFLILLSFVLGGFGAYLLVKYLTGSTLAGVTGGIIYAFCPFRFDQMSHLHVLSSQWIPFALLYLHRYFDKDNWKDLILFSIFFFFQFISAGQNGLFMSVAVGIVVMYTLIFFERYGKKKSIKVLLALFFLFILILPFYYPYIWLAKHMGFIRPKSEFELYSPTLISYLGPYPGSLLYGKLLARFSRPEKVLFPGFFIIGFLIWKLLKGVKKIIFYRNLFRIPDKFKKWKIGLDFLIFIDLVVIAILTFLGEINLGWSILGVKLKVSGFERPLYILLGLVIVKIALGKDSARKILREIKEDFYISRKWGQVYWIILLCGFLCSFGLKIKFMDKDLCWGPFSLLYSYVPGFNGLRTPGRFFVTFILASAVLIGFFIRELGNKGYRKYWLYTVPMILFLEYISIPLPLRVKVGKTEKVYEWLGKQQDIEVILELPMPTGYHSFYKEAQYMLNSTHHWKSL